MPPSLRRSAFATEAIHFKDLKSKNGLPRPAKSAGLAMTTLCGLAMTCILLLGCTTLSPQNKKSAELNVQLAVGYMEQDHMERAKQKLLLALEQAPNWPPALDAMALYAEKTGDIETARDYYQRSLDLAPNDGNVQNNYGAFLCRQGKLKEAERHFLKAVQDPQYLHAADAYENAGLCALKIPDKKLARNYFKKALLYSPGRAKTLKELQNLDGASL